jgi:hypothetical protein
MKPIKFFQVAKWRYREDFGHEWYIQLFFTDRWALFQGSVSWNDFPSWPYIQITSGSNGLLSILFWVYKFGFDIGVIERTWNWDYMKKVDEEDTNYLKMDE